MNHKLEEPEWNNAKTVLKVEVSLYKLDDL